MFDFELFGYTFQLQYVRELAIAYVLALPIAADRERARRSAGLRTFPIVSIASCSFLLIARDLFGGEPEPLARVFYGLMTGIGFIGGGAIVKQRGNAHGTATAASIWATGAIGAAVAFERYGIGIAITVIVYATLLLFKPVKGVLDDGEERERDDAS